MHRCIYLYLEELWEVRRWMKYHEVVGDDIGCERWYFFHFIYVIYPREMLIRNLLGNFTPISWCYYRYINMIETTILIHFWVTLDNPVHQLLILYRNEVTEIVCRGKFSSASASSMLCRRWVSLSSLAFAWTFFRFVFAFLRLFLVISILDRSIFGRDPTLDNFRSLAMIESSFFQFVCFTQEFRRN